MASTTAAHTTVVFFAIANDEYQRCTFCRFCLAPSHPTTKCPAIPPPIYEKLSNTRESNKRTLLKRTKWIQPNGYRGCSVGQGGNSTPKTVQLATAANTYTPARQKSLLASQTFAIASMTEPASKNALDNYLVPFTPISRPPDESAVEVTKCDSSVESSTHGKSATATRTNIDSTEKTDTSPNEHLRSTSPTRPYEMSIQ